MTPHLHLRRARDLQGEAIFAHDGQIGFVADLYFDDKVWTARYLVVDTGRTMPRREVLIPCELIARGGSGDGSIRVRLTREEVEKSPEADTALPVSRQHELSYAARARSDPHLRSSEVVTGYYVQGRDGTAGHVRDILVDSRDWTIAAFVVATYYWLPGRGVVISPWSVERIDWPDRVVHVGISRATFRELRSLQT